LKAATRGQAAVVKYLCAVGASIHVQNEWGVTAAQMLVVGYKPSALPAGFTYSARKNQHPPPPAFDVDEARKYLQRENRREVLKFLMARGARVIKTELKPNVGLFWTSAIEDGKKSFAAAIQELSAVLMESVTTFPKDVCGVVCHYLIGVPAAGFVKTRQDVADGKVPDANSPGGKVPDTSLPDGNVFDLFDDTDATKSESTLAEEFLGSPKFEDDKDEQRPGFFDTFEE